MADKLFFLTCRGFQNEVAAAISAEGWDDVFSAAFPTRCGQPSASWEELGALLPRDCTQVVVLGQSCMNSIGEPPSGFTPTRVMHLEECFHLVAGVQLVEEAITGGAYLITPAWLAGWRGHLKEMGFEPEEAGNFFHDFARELVLLDTGTDPDARTHLTDLQECVKLYSRRIPVGLDHIRLLLTRLVLEWRLEMGQGTAKRHSTDYLAIRRSAPGPRSAPVP